jgi:3-oxoacyl-[acyl-carrier protein] reductase
MDLMLKGKTALVTGSSSGIGTAIAMELASEGVDLIVHGRDVLRTESVARKAAALGVDVLATIGDLTQEEDSQRIVEAVFRRFDGVDILVNNAGAVLQMDKSNWLEVDASAWLDSYNTNVLASLRLTQRLAPAMTRRGWGRIINISSISGSHMRGRIFDYGAAKAALNSFTVNLSKVLAPGGVTVNCIVPGVILSPAVERWIETLRRQEGWPDDFSECERRYISGARAQPVPRLGRPREIAVAVALLASPLSGYTTGAFLRIDGGAPNSIGA